METKVVNVLEMAKAVAALEAEIARWQPQGRLVTNVVEAEKLDSFKKAMAVFEEQMKEFQLKNGNLLGAIETARVQVEVAAKQSIELMARNKDLEEQLARKSEQLEKIASVLPNNDLLVASPSEGPAPAFAPSSPGEKLNEEMNQP